MWNFENIMIAKIVKNVLNMQLKMKIIKYVVVISNYFSVYLMSW